MNQKVYLAFCSVILSCFLSVDATHNTTHHTSSVHNTVYNSKSPNSLSTIVISHNSKDNEVDDNEGVIIIEDPEYPESNLVAFFNGTGNASTVIIDLNNNLIAWEQESAFYEKARDISHNSKDNEADDNEGYIENPESPDSNLVALFNSTGNAATVIDLNNNLIAWEQESAFYEKAIISDLVSHIQNSKDNEADDNEGYIENPESPDSNLVALFNGTGNAATVIDLNNNLIAWEQESAFYEKISHNSKDNEADDNEGDIIIENPESPDSNLVTLLNSTGNASTVIDLNNNLIAWEQESAFYDKISHNSKDNEVDAKAGLIIIANTDSNLIGWFNATGNGAMVIDLNNNLIALVNENHPSEVVIDVNNKNGVYCTDPHPSKVKKETDRQYLSSLKNGLKPFLSQKNAIKFKLDKVSSKILKAINEILNSLVHDISAELRSNPKAGLEFFLAAGKELLELQYVEGIVPTLGIKGVSVRGDLARSTNVIKGLVILLRRVPGGLPALVEDGAKIRLQKISDSKDGLESLAEFIREIGVQDVEDILGDLLNDPESLLNVIRLLGGNSNNGVNGILKATATLASYANGNSSLEYLLNVMVQFVALNSENDPEVISSQLKQSISEVLEAIDGAECGCSLSEAAEVLKSLDEGNLIINEVKISSIISRLISTIGLPADLQILFNVIPALIERSQRSGVEESLEDSPEEILPKFLSVLILNVDSPLGINLLERVGISTGIETSEISGGILEHILKSVPNITSRLQHDLYEGLRSVPVFNKIIKSMNSAISKAGLHTNIKELLKANKDAENTIKSILQDVGGLKLEVPDDTSSKVHETVESCSGVNFYTSVMTTR